MNLELPPRVAAAYRANPTCECGRATRVERLMGGHPSFEGWELRCEGALAFLGLRFARGAHLRLLYHLDGTPVLRLLPDRRDP